MGAFGVPSRNKAEDARANSSFARTIRTPAFRDCIERSLMLREWSPYPNNAKARSLRSKSSIDSPSRLRTNPARVIKGSVPQVITEYCALVFN